MQPPIWNPDDGNKWDDLAALVVIIAWAIITAWVL